MQLTDGTNALDRWLLVLNAYGSLGWEVVGITAADPTIGANCYTAVLKRAAPSLPPPADTAVGWRPDPSGRFQVRHWDGVRWTQHVSTGGVSDSDFPNVRADA
jgi:hypothetical protein